MGDGGLEKGRGTRMKWGDLSGEVKGLEGGSAGFWMCWLSVTCLPQLWPRWLGL